MEDHVEVWLPGQVREDQQTVSRWDCGPVLNDGNDSDPFQVSNGVKQGCALARMLFSDVLGDADRCLQGDSPQCPHQVQVRRKAVQSLASIGDH